MLYYGVGFPYEGYSRLYNQSLLPWRSFPQEVDDSKPKPNPCVVLLSTIFEFIWFNNAFHTGLFVAITVLYAKNVRSFHANGVGPIEIIIFPIINFGERSHPAATPAGPQTPHIVSGVDDSRGTSTLTLPHPTLAAQKALIALKYAMLTRHEYERFMTAPPNVAHMWNLQLQLITGWLGLSDALIDVELSLASRLTGEVLISL